MATLPSPSTGTGPSTGSATGIMGALRTQSHVIGALIMRELHTRYGRENVGYLWMILEPMMFASMIALLHSGHRTEYGGGMSALPFAVLGYCSFIIFRGIFNRAEGAIEVNMPLLYHKMVTIFDIMMARALLEGAGTFVCLVVIMGLLTSFGLAEPPERPLYLVAGAFFMLWFSFALSLIIVAGTHENRLLGRFVHPISYILMPLSGAFYQVAWIPQPYREWVQWFPMTHIFELIRYGYFRSGKDDYVNYVYLFGTCLVLTYFGLVAVKLVRSHIHLN